MLDKPVLLAKERMYPIQAKHPDHSGDHVPDHVLFLDEGYCFAFSRLRCFLKPPPLS